jgi:antitoxin component of MazEF toxin-antitoxin module
MHEKKLTVESRVERDEHGNAVIRIPLDFAKQAGLKTGEYARVEVDESSGTLTIAPMPFKPRARYNYREIAHEVIEEERELLDRLAAYDRGEEP